ncbi:MerR family transcriptional regulator [Streptomyces sp. NPDC059999]|uniref:MerR family transcriptional regulator n=1 Tax=Streptomyces sp. NPDC059999 TaxID=3347030 RepID=UPI0036856B57
MWIGEAAAAAGTTPRALRFYEQRGLLTPPARTASGRREYGPGEVARVRVIRDLLAHGFTVEDLRGVAQRLHVLVDGPPVGCDGSGVVGDRLAALDAEIDRLTRLRERLARRAGVRDDDGTGPGGGSRVR